MHIVRKTGNNAAHYGKQISAKDALISLKYIFDLLKWLANSYSENVSELPAAFDESFIPKVGEKQRKLKEQQQEQEREYKKLQNELELLRKQKEELLEKAKKTELSLENYRLKVIRAKKLAEERRTKRRIPFSFEYTEAETRVHLIDVSLKEAGWTNLRAGHELEFPVKGMPISPDNPNGNGKADYVLWGDNGKPLAVIEAKRSSKDPENGRYQAYLYANCLEQMYQQRPVIFYTNGFETFIWEEQFYTHPRKVYGFYTKDELQWLIQQRHARKDIRTALVNNHIAGRYYQLEAIQRVTESFVTGAKENLRGAARNALLVMATGSGKTRTAAALVDVLFKNNWIKRVLFLADRNALVRQAKNNFGEYLPELSAINLTEELELGTTRLVFSTYQTIMNKIDQMLNPDGRFYGIGHFDLIIIDEAHRSVYNRYKTIFEYFDALLVGLTATPKESIDHNTFELFGCSTNDPTYEFSLKEATPTYLTPFKNFDIETGFIRDGIKYQKLSEKEKALFEETFMDKSTGDFPEEIKASALNKWLFNKDTVNKVLDVFIKNSLKIEGGDRIGRSIIFAVNQNHAKFIVDCFEERYPHYPSGYMAMIHNQVSHAQSLIDSFTDAYKENLPQIVVSVDMMDTGIDAPRVLNLVFFKIVRSYSKFWQMIGRGTRLCPDVFGPGSDKEYFKIFDVCKNFEFFEEDTNEDESNNLKPVSRQIFEARLELSRLLTDSGEDENIVIATQLRDQLHASIQNLNKERFEVKMAMRYVHEFSERNRWNNINASDIHTIEEYLSALPLPESINESARRFDLLMLKLQQAQLLQLKNEKKYHEKLILIAEELSVKYTIPEVKRAKPLIERMREPEFYKQLSQRKIEEIRNEIRELVQYLEIRGRQAVYTNIEDTNASINFHEFSGLPYSENISYKKRVESFVRQNKHHITISKLATNEPITSDELIELERILFKDSEIGTKDDYEKEYGHQPLGTFIRSILGLTIEAAHHAFSEFIQAGNISADQMTFINTIIAYLTKNGTIDKNLLFEPPFTHSNDQGLIGIFDDAAAGKIIRIIDEINGNANVG
jgi:type I restriction enzyme R subunit